MGREAHGEEVEGVTVTYEEAERQAYIDFALERTVVSSGIVPETDDLFLTLSTCTGNGHDTRWVVQAVKVVEESGEETQDPQPPEAAPSAGVPDDMPVSSEVAEETETAQPELAPSGPIDETGVPPVSSETAETEPQTVLV